MFFSSFPLVSNCIWVGSVRYRRSIRVKYRNNYIVWCRSIDPQTQCSCVTFKWIWRYRMNNRIIHKNKGYKIVIIDQFHYLWLCFTLPSSLSTQLRFSARWWWLSRFYFIAGWMELWLFLWCNRVSSVPVYSPLSVKP